MPTLLEQLDLEWHHHIGHNPRLACKIPELGDLTGAATLDEARTWTHAASAADADAVLVALVRRAVDGDALAARALLQFLMPGIVGIVRRWSNGIGLADTEAVVIAAVYDRIRTYPIERRPRKIAANVLLDATRPIRRLVCHPANNDHHQVHSHDPADTPCRPPSDELLELIADAVAGGHITPADAELIITNRIHGIELTSLAAANGCHARTLQRHRKRAETALGTAARTELAAA